MPRQEVRCAHRDELGLAAGTWLRPGAKGMRFEWVKGTEVYSLEHLKRCGHHATVTPSRITPFSSDHGRQTGLGQISTTLGDHAGISGAVAFCMRILCCGPATRSASDHTLLPREEAVTPEQASAAPVAGTPCLGGTSRVAGVTAGQCVRQQSGGCLCLYKAPQLAVVPGLSLSARGAATVLAAASGRAVPQNALWPSTLQELLPCMRSA